MFDRKAIWNYLKMLEFGWIFLQFSYTKIFTLLAQKFLTETHSVEENLRVSGINESIEMGKVYIFSENVHEKHTSAMTNAYAFFLGIFIVLFSFLLEKPFRFMPSL